ncbi:hypothetical protein CN553_27455, partial [Bacillus cereus]
PTGATGTFSTSFASIGSTGAAIVAQPANTPIPLDNNFVLVGTDISHTAGSGTITLNTAGSYLVAYSIMVDPAAGLTAGTFLDVNAVQLAYSITQSTLTATTAGFESLSKTIIITVAAGSTLDLRILFVSDIQFAMVTIMRLS